MSTEPQFFTAPDGTEMAIIPRARLEALLEAEQDLEDAEAVAEGRASLAADGGIPADVERAIAAGTNPVRAWRTFRALTQQELADKVDLTQAAIARIEKADPGAGKPETLAALAEALDAPRWTLEHATPKGFFETVVESATKASDATAAALTGSGALSYVAARECIEALLDRAKASGRGAKLKSSWISEIFNSEHAGASKEQERVVIVYHHGGKSAEAYDVDDLYAPFRKPAVYAGGLTTAVRVTADKRYVAGSPIAADWYQEVDAALKRGEE